MLAACNLALAVPSIGIQSLNFCLGYLHSPKQTLVNTALTRPSSDSNKN